MIPILFTNLGQVVNNFQQNQCVMELDSILQEYMLNMYVLSFPKSLFHKRILPTLHPEHIVPVETLREEMSENSQPYYPGAVRFSFPF